MHFVYLTLLLFVSFTVKGKVPVVIALTHIPQVLEFENEQAPYNKLIKAIEQKISVPTRYEFMPSERGNRLLAKGKIDCIFPIIPADYERSEKTAFSTPINGISLNLFALNQRYKGFDELEGKIVVHLRGYLFANARKKYPSIKFFPASNQENALNMLKNGRASAYLDYLPDVRFSIPKEQMQLLQYDKENPVLKANDSFECKDSGHAKDFLKQLEKAVELLDTQGQLKTILADYYVPVRPK